MFLIFLPSKSFIMEKDPEQKEREVVLSFVDIKGKDVLEIGCGMGRFSNIIMELGAKSLVAIDRWSGRVELANNLLKEKWPRAFFMFGVGGQLPWDDERFDLVVFSFSLHEHSDPEVGLKDAFKCVKPGGGILILEPRHDGELCQFLSPLFSEEEGIVSADTAILNFTCTDKKHQEFFMNWHFKNRNDLYKELLKGENETNESFIKSISRKMVSKFKAKERIVLRDKVVCWYLAK